MAGGIFHDTGLRRPYRSSPPGGRRILRPYGSLAYYFSGHLVSSNFCCGRFWCRGDLGLTAVDESSSEIHDSSGGTLFRAVPDYCWRQWWAQRLSLGLLSVSASMADHRRYNRRVVDRIVHDHREVRRIVIRAEVGEGSAPAPLPPPMKKGSLSGPFFVGEFTSKKMAGRDCAKFKKRGIDCWVVGLK